MTEKLKRLQRAAGPVSRETLQLLLDFEALFLKWASVINLAGPSTLVEVWDRHVVDSAQLLRHAPSETRWVDLGSGGGFPGIVVAIFLKERTLASIDMVEANSKKAAFLQTAITSFDLPARVHVKRIELSVSSMPPTQIVTARALAPLSELLGMSAPLLHHGARGLFHKGRGYRRELEECHDQWAFDLIEHPSLVETGSVILEIAQLRRLK